jgi:hypothetical protein
VRLPPIPIERHQRSSPEPKLPWDGRWQPWRRGLSSACSEVEGFCCQVPSEPRTGYAARRTSFNATLSFAFRF